MALRAVGCRRSLQTLLARSARSRVPRLNHHSLRRCDRECPVSARGAPKGNSQNVIGRDAGGRIERRIVGRRSRNIQWRLVPRVDAIDQCVDPDLGVRQAIRAMFFVDRRGAEQKGDVVSTALQLSAVGAVQVVEYPILRRLSGGLPHSRMSWSPSSRTCRVATPDKSS
jgi:hypothetical protein